MASFYTILTSVGQAKVANAVALGQKVNLSTLAVGDANGVTPQPDASAKALVHERRRAPLNRVEVDKDNPNFIVCEQVLPPEVGGWEIREIGVFDDEGNLIAYGNYPPTYKPLLNEGTSRTQTVRMVMQVSDTAAVTLKVDPSVVLATRQYVDNKEEVLKSITDEIKKALGSLKDEAILKKATALLASVELYGKTGFIDWHFDGSEEDYTTRLIEESKGLLKLIGGLNISEGLTLGKPLDISSGGTGANTAEQARRNLELQDGARMTKSTAHVTGLAGNANEAATTEQLVQLRNMTTVKTYGDQSSGRRVYADGYCEQWGRIGYSDIASSTTPTVITVQFPVTFSQSLGCVAVPDTTQKVSLSRKNLGTSSVLFDLREFSDGAISGSVGWLAWGYL